jgi:hypothetical protein
MRAFDPREGRDYTAICGGKEAIVGGVTVLQALGAMARR